MDFPRRRIFAPPRPVLLRPARSLGGLFSEERRSVRRKKAAFPQKLRVDPAARGPSLCLEVDALGLGVFGFLFDALLFDEVIDGLRRLRLFGLFFGSLFGFFLR